MNWACISSSSFPMFFSIFKKLLLNSNRFYGLDLKALIGAVDTFFLAARPSTKFPYIVVRSLSFVTMRLLLPAQCSLQNVTRNNLVIIKIPKSLNNNNRGSIEGNIALSKVAPFSNSRHVYVSLEVTAHIGNFGNSRVGLLASLIG